MEHGHYWVKFYGEWTIGFFNGQNWAIIASDESCDTKEFSEIGRFLGVEPQ